MNANSLEVAKNMWAISNQVQKQKLMHRFLEMHGELTSNNDFAGFLVIEFGLDKNDADVDPGGDRERPESR